MYNGLKMLFNYLVPLREMDPPSRKSDAQMKAEIYDEQSPRWRYYRFHQHVNEQALLKHLCDGWEPFQISDIGYVFVKKFC